MHWLPVVLTILTACDFHPPRRDRGSEPGRPAAAAPVDAAVAANPVRRVREPTPPPPPPAAVIDAGVAEPAGSGSGSAVPAIPTDSECMAVAVHFADRLIASETNPTEKAQLEQEKTKIVRSTSRMCVKDKWSTDVRACLLAAKTKNEIETCTKALQPKQR